MDRDAGTVEVLESTREGDSSRAGQSPETSVSHSSRLKFSRKAATVVVVLVIVAVLLVAAWISSGVSRPEVTILIIVPLTGASSYLVDVDEAMSLVANKINRWGGLNGAKIRLIIEDCESDPEIAAQKFAEAEEKYNPIAVVTPTRGAAEQLASLAEESGVVLISVGFSTEELIEGMEWSFRYYPSSDSEVGSAMSILHKLNVSSLGMLYVNDPCVITTKAALAETFEDAGGFVEELMFAETCEAEIEDLSDVLDNEAIYVAALRCQFAAVFAELNNSGYEGHVLSSSEAAAPDLWGIPDAQGVYVNAPIIYNPRAAISSTFPTEFEEYYGRELTFSGAVGADVMMLIWGLLQDREVSRDMLRQQLNQGFVFSGILGVVESEEGSNSVEIPLYPAQIIGGELEYL